MTKGIAQIFQTRLSDVYTKQFDPLGSIRFEGNSVYKYCKVMNTSGTVAGVAGDAVGYADNIAGAGYNVHTVCMNHNDQLDIPVGAGVLMGTYVGTLLVAEYGWVQIKGPATLNTAVVNGDAGKCFNLSTTDKTFTLNADDTSLIAGVSLNDTTGVIIDCPF